MFVKPCSSVWGIHQKVCTFPGQVVYKIHRSKSSKTGKTNPDLERHQAGVMGRALPKKAAIKGAKNVIIVASGKGGVGKSTTAVNLAVALKAVYPQKQIGLLDTDVFGPSVPLMLNLNETPLLDDDNLMVPLVNYGVHCMSMGFLIDEKAAVIWRGLMVMQALQKLLREVAWPDVEYLILDTPPGTGDTLLSIARNIPIQGALLVTTPQSAALQVTRRGVTMFQKLSIPIIGLVENMSWVNCPKCSANIALFGSATALMAKEIAAKVIVSLPLDREISDGSDRGVPVVVGNPDGVQSNAYKSLAAYVVQTFDKK